MHLAKGVRFRTCASPFRVAYVGLSGQRKDEIKVMTLAALIPIHDRPFPSKICPSGQRSHEQRVMNVKAHHDSRLTFPTLTIHNSPLTFSPLTIHHSRSHRNTRDLNVHVLGQPAHLHRLPRRRRIGEILAVDLIHPRKVSHVFEENGAFHDIAER